MCVCVCVCVWGGGGGGGGDWRLVLFKFCVYNLVREILLLSGKSQGFFTLMSVATMNFSEAVSIRLHKLLVLVRDFVCFI